jgi:hypothetical protein
MTGATLCRWATVDILLGTALHLRNARHRFVFGGQSYVPVGARLDAKPMGTSMRGCPHRISATYWPLSIARSIASSHRLVCAARTSTNAVTLRIDG